jgi:hypothetical protein
VVTTGPVPARGSYDLSWFTGTVLTPRQAVKQLLDLFVDEHTELRVTTLANATGRSAEDVKQSLPLLIAEHRLAVVEDDDSDPLLRLGDREASVRTQSEKVG